MKISENLTEASRQLAESGVPDAARESSSLLQYALQKDRVFLFLYPEYELTSDEQTRFSDALRRRCGREPLQYITGRQEFYGLEFFVTPDVLIPRPETEMLVAKMIELLKHYESPTFAEIGVGSGCIATSALVNLPNVRAAASDVSRAAILVAETNAGRHGVSKRIEFIESDLFENFGGRRFDLIVSNPPYVPAADMSGLQPEVRVFEPNRALTDGSDGLSIIRRIIRDAHRFLRPEGCLILEIGFGQAESVAGLFDAELWSSVEIAADFQGIPRMAVAFLR